VTFIQTLQIYFFDFIIRQIRKSLAQSLKKELFRKPGQFECLEQSLLRRHTPKRLNVQLMIGAFFDIHNKWSLHNSVRRVKEQSLEYTAFALSYIFLLVQI